MIGSYRCVRVMDRGFLTTTARARSLVILGWIPPSIHLFFTARVRSTTEGYSFTLLVCSRGGGSGPAAGGGGAGSKVNPVGGGCQGQRSIQLGGRGRVRSSCQGSSGSKVNPAGGEGQRSIQPGGVRSIQWGGGSPSCALLRAVCLLRSRRRTFLLIKYILTILVTIFSNGEFNVCFRRQHQQGSGTQDAAQH